MCRCRKLNELGGGFSIWKSTPRQIILRHLLQLFFYSVTTIFRSYSRKVSIFLNSVRKELDMEGEGEWHCYHLILHDLECWYWVGMLVCRHASSLYHYQPINKAKRTRIWSPQQTDWRTSEWNEYIKNPLNPLWPHYVQYIPPCLPQRGNKILRSPRIDSKEPIPPGCVVCK